MGFRIRFISISIIAVSLLLLIVSFATSSGAKRTAFGSILGEDHAGFHTAGWTLNHLSPVALYDLETQDHVYHELHPYLTSEEHLPYLHPPFVAVAFQPLARLPYRWSFAVWLVISMGFYLTGVLVLLRTIHFKPGDRTTALLAALSFEPFIMECWIGGQLSAVGFCFLAIGSALDLKPKWRFASGLALGACLYKPTLLVVIVPALVAGRRWQTLLGVTAMGLALASFSWAMVGWDCNIAFLNKLLGFSSDNNVDGNSLALRTWKYLDFNTMSRTLANGSKTLQLVLFAILAVPTLGIVLYCAGRRYREWDSHHDAIWAALILATPIINLYVCIYDGIVVVAGAIWLLRPYYNRGHIPYSVKAWLIAMYSIPWITQWVAMKFQVQLFSLVLLGAICWICLDPKRANRDASDSTIARGY